MKLQQVPEKYKIYSIFMSNKDTYKMNGEELSTMLKSPNPLVLFKNNEGFNRAFLVNWKIDNEATRKNVFNHKEELEEIDSRLKLLEQDSA